MNDDKRRLTVDPKLFEFSSNSSRKKREKNADPNKIKIKTANPKKKNDSLKKRSILKMIREHQEDRYKQMFENENKPIKTQSPDVNDFNKDFTEAKLFMENLAEKTSQNQKIKNNTLKNYHPVTTNSLLYHPIAENLEQFPLPNLPISPAIHLAPPKYGCLKNGKLPTYRTYMNATQKNFPVQVAGASPKPDSVVSNVFPEHIIAEQQINETLNRVNEIKQTAEKLEELKTKTKPMRKKQKKTLRRTYKIGKSTSVPQVSVLISNKTIRNNISTKTNSLKQVPIQEVKRFLIKHGFIKVGSTAPNDVLRKMYESSMLICGELHNHNPDNLLYNFLNTNNN